MWEAGRARAEIWRCGVACEFRGDSEKDAQSDLLKRAVLMHESESRCGKCEVRIHNLESSIIPCHLRRTLLFYCVPYSSTFCVFWSACLLTDSL